MIKILLLIAVLFLIGLAMARFVIPFLFNRIKNDVEVIKEKLKNDKK